MSLPADVLHYAEQYRKTHGLKTRSEVLTKALKLLREQELVVGYRAMAQEQAQLEDVWLDSDLSETLKGIDES